MLASELEPNAKSVSFFVGYGQAFLDFSDFPKFVGTCSRYAKTHPLDSAKELISGLSNTLERRSFSVSGRVFDYFF